MKCGVSWFFAPENNVVEVPEQGGCCTAALTIDVIFFVDHLLFYLFLASFQFRYGFASAGTIHQFGVIYFLWNLLAGACTVHLFNLLLLDSTTVGTIFLQRSVRRKDFFTDWASSKGFHYLCLKAPVNIVATTLTRGFEVWRNQYLSDVATSIC